MSRLCRITSILVLLALLLSACQPIQPVEAPAKGTTELDADMQATLDGIVENWMAGTNTPGMALTVVKDGQIVYSKGFGVMQVGTGQPVTPQTLFHMASISKTFVATALMRLVEDGKLDLDARLVDILPYFTMADERYKKITIRQMMAHLSGIPDVPEGEPWWKNWGFENPQVDDGALDRYVRSLGDMTLAQAPGEAHLYSDINFDILGDVVAQLSGETFESYIQKHILAPLGMDDAGFLMVNDPERLASPHEHDADGNPVVAPVYPYNRIHAPSAALLTSTEELAKWAQTALNRGELNGTRILPAARFVEMWEQQAETGYGEWPVYGSPISGYGLGWYIGTVGNEPVVGHAGANLGFNSHLIVAPDKGIGITAATNYSDLPNGVFPASFAAIEAMYALLGVEPDAAAPAEVPAALDDATVAQIETLVADAMGATGAPGFQVCVVKDGAVVYSQAFGLADVETGKEATTRSLQIQGSVTKPLTALAVMRLAEQGQVDLDAPLTDYLPYFAMADERYKDITVRMVLTHRSGMPNSPDFWAEPLDPSMNPLEQAVRDLAEMYLLFEPGTKWSYSAYGYSALGALIAEVTGQSYEAYMQAEWLAPLGMADSTLVPAEVDPDLAMTGYKTSWPSGQPEATPTNCDARDASTCLLVSSCDDMSKLAAMLLNGGELSGTRFLASETLRAMWEPISDTGYRQAMGPVYGPPFEFYGIGWGVGEVDGRRLVNHAGVALGANAHIQLAPDDGLAVIAMTNWTDFSYEGLYPAITVAIDTLNVLLGEEP